MQNIHQSGATGFRQVQKNYLSLITHSSRMRPPFIIIGMHRSGTSILAKVLEKSGIFMGVIKDPNFEAMHFLSINQQVLWKSGFNWYNPGVPEKQNWHPISNADLFQEHFRLNGRLAQWKQWLRNENWGWKDPRNIFTLPMWLNKFPKAKVIHLVRDPQAVVQSLQNRNRVPGEVQVKELESADFCLNLYEQYLHQGRSYQKILGDSYLELQYEKLKAHDEESIQRLNAFCKTSVDAALKSYFR